MVGVEFTGAIGIGVVGMGWVITLTLYLLFAGSLVLLFLLHILGPGALLVKGLLLWEGALVLGCAWVWGWVLGLGLHLPSNSTYVIISSDKGWVGTKPWAPGIT